MSKLSQEDMLSFYFNRSLQLEDLMLKKLELPKKMLKNTEHEQMVRDFRRNAQVHIKDLNEKMKLLGIQ